MEIKRSQDLEVLLTAFEAFGGEKINPSQEIVRKISKMSKKNFTNMNLNILILPVSYERSIKILEDYYEKHEVDLVIHIGQAGGRNIAEIERLAVNVKDSVHPDNDNITETGSKIVDNGADAYLTKLNVKKIAEILNLKKKLPVGISYNAGQYICNEIYYFSLHTSATKNNPKNVLFIHMPFLPSQVAAKFPKNNNLPSMDLGTQVKVVIETLRVLQNELNELN